MYNYSIYNQAYEISQYLCLMSTHAINGSLVRRDHCTKTEPQFSPRPLKFCICIYVSTKSLSNHTLMLQQYVSRNKSKYIFKRKIRMSHLEYEGWLRKKKHLEEAYREMMPSFHPSAKT